MLLNLTWLIPGIPIIASIFIAALLLSFSKTMNRLTKPVSYVFITSLALSEIVNFILLRNNISGNDLIFGSNLTLVVDRPALIFSESIGFVFLIVMLFSLTKLQRRIGYVRYFIVLGFFSGFFYLFSFSGDFFHKFYDLFISYINIIGMKF